MKVRRLRWQRYRVALHRPIATAHGEMRHREGLILRLTADDGTEGVGEVSPLPEFDGTTLADCVRALTAVAPRLPGMPLAGLPPHLDAPAGRLPAALRGGLDVAALDALGRGRGRPIAGLLVGEPRATVAVNATVGGDRDAAAAARAAVAAGFGTVKVKVGLLEELGDEVRRIAAVREAIGPVVKLRLDANGAWRFEAALRAAEALAQFDVEYLEQPVAADDLAGLARVRGGSPILIAADEAVGGIEAARRVLEAGAADVLVVKPAIAGGATAGRAIADMAAAHGVASVVTTALDTGVGIAAAIQLAATLPSDAPACGLATADLLVADLVRGLPSVERGAIACPTGPGLGVEIDEIQLARHACGSRDEAVS